MELDILKLLSTKENYHKYNRYVILDRLGEEIQAILRDIPDYYSETGRDEIDWDEFQTWFTTLKHTTMDPLKLDIVCGVCDILNKTTSPVADIVLKNFLVRDYATQIAQTAFDLLEGKPKTMDDLDKLFKEYNRDVEKLSTDLTESRFSVDDWEAMLSEDPSTALYEWELDELDLILGPLRKGDFIILGARPDAGKTTLLATQIAHFAKKLPKGECILWCNNEESVKKVRTRQAQAILGWTNEEVSEDPAITKAEIARVLGGSDKIVLFDEGDMSIDDIDDAIARYKPSIIVIDQIWKVTGFESKASSEIQRYGLLAKYVRNIAKRVGPVIGVSQLGDGAQGLKYPDMSTLYMSKTAVQGEADAILLIGSDPETGANTRYLHAPKNKMAFAHPKYRKAGLAVELDGEIARYISKVGKRRSTA